MKIRVKSDPTGTTIRTVDGDFVQEFRLSDDGWVQTVPQKEAVNGITALILDGYVAAGDGDFTLSETTLQRV